MGHWLLLLPSRRYAYMFIGLGCWLIAAVSMATGKTLAGGEPFRART